MRRGRVYAMLDAASSPDEEPQLIMVIPGPGAWTGGAV
jgi:hypothetical protein